MRSILRLTSRIFVENVTSSSIVDEVVPTHRIERPGTVVVQRDFAAARDALRALVQPQAPRT